MRHGVIGTAASEQGSTAGMEIGLLGGAFRLGRRIGQCEYDRPRVERGHCVQQFRGERAADRRDADNRSRLERADRGHETVDRGMRMGIREFVLGEVAAFLHDQAAQIDQPIALARLGLGQALRLHGGDHEVRDPGCRLPGAKKQQCLVSEPTAGHPQG